MKCDIADRDECSDGSSGCEQLCSNTDGSFNCSCRDGYSLFNEKFCTGNSICLYFDYRICWMQCHCFLSRQHGHQYCAHQKMPNAVMPHFILTSEDLKILMK